VPPSRVIGKIISRRASKDASHDASESAGPPDRMEQSDSRSLVKATPAEVPDIA